MLGCYWEGCEGGLNPERNVSMWKVVAEVEGGAGWEKVEWNTEFEQNIEKYDKDLHRGWVFVD